MVCGGVSGNRVPAHPRALAQRTRKVVRHGSSPHLRGERRPRNHGRTLPGVGFPVLCSVSQSAAWMPVVRDRAERAGRPGRPVQASEVATRSAVSATMPTATRLSSRDARRRGARSGAECCPAAERGQQVGQPEHDRDAERWFQLVNVAQRCAALRLRRSGPRAPPANPGRPYKPAANRTIPTQQDRHQSATAGHGSCASRPDWRPRRGSSPALRRAGSSEAAAVASGDIEAAPSCRRCAASPSTMPTASSPDLMKSRKVNRSGPAGRVR